MSWRGLKPKPHPMPLWLEEWNANVEALNDIYNWLFGGTADVKFKSVTAERGEFKEELLVGGKRVLKDGDPVYIGGFVDEGKDFENFVRSTLDSLKSLTSQIYNVEKAIKDILDRLEASRLYAVAKGIVALEVQVDTNPKPITTDSIRSRRLLIKVPTTSTTTVYVGDSQQQLFPIEPGQKVELFVEDPSKVYVKASGNTKVYVLIEVVQ